MIEIPYYSYFKLAEELYGVPWAILAGIAHIESGMDQKARGSLGEMGLMQFMETTWEEWGMGDPWDARDSILSAARYLRWLIATLDARGRGTWKWALVAYNWGIGKALSVSSWKDIPPEPYSYSERVLGQARIFAATELELKVTRGGNEKVMQ